MALRRGGRRRAAAGREREVAGSQEGRLLITLACAGGACSWEAAACAHPHSPLSIPAQHKALPSCAPVGGQPLEGSAKAVAGDGAQPLPCLRRVQAGCVCSGAALVPTLQGVRGLQQQLCCLALRWCHQATSFAAGSAWRVVSALQALHAVQLYPWLAHLLCR